MIAGVLQHLKDDYILLPDQSLQIRFDLNSAGGAYIMNDIGKGKYALLSMLSSAILGQMNFLANIIDKDGKGTQLPAKNAWSPCVHRHPLYKSAQTGLLSSLNI